MRGLDKIYEYRAMERVADPEVFLDNIRNEAKHRTTCQKNRTKRKKKK